MKKILKRLGGGIKPGLPDAVLEKLVRAYQRPAQADLACPPPEEVISSALEELEPAAEQQLYTHLLTCRDCLELFLAVRLARDEAETPADQRLEEPVREGLSETGRLARWGRRLRETWQGWSTSGKLIPTLAGVSLVLLVVLWGRLERAPLPPPAQLALKRQPAPAAPAVDALPPEPADVRPSPGTGLLAARKKFDPAAPALEKFAADLDGRREPMGLVFQEEANGGTRLAYRADRDAFAYLFQQDPAGKITLLQAGKLSAHKTYHYPDPAKPSQPKATMAGGAFFLVATSRPAPDLDTRLQALEREGTGRMESIFPDAVIRSLPDRLP